MASTPYQQGSSVYQKYFTTLLPTAFQDLTGQALAAAIGAGFDSLVDRFKACVKIDMAGLSPPDALLAVGADRLIVRGPNESDASYSARTIDAWNEWPWAGTAFGLLRALLGLGYSDVMLAQANGGVLYSLDSNGNLLTSSESNGVWSTDALKPPTYSPLLPAFWSKFDVLFISPLPSSWGGGASLPGSNSDEMNRIRLVIANWKPGHSTCNRITAVTSGRVLGYPLRTLGGGNGTLGSNSTTNWSP